MQEFNFNQDMQILKALDHYLMKERGNAKDTILTLQTATDHIETMILRYGYDSYHQSKVEELEKKLNNYYELLDVLNKAEEAKHRSLKEGRDYKIVDGRIYNL